MTYDPAQYTVSVDVKREERKVQFGFSWKWKDIAAGAAHEADAADPDWDCINLGFQHLLAAALGGKGCWR